MIVDPVIACVYQYWNNLGQQRNYRKRNCWSGALTDNPRFALLPLGRISLAGNSHSLRAVEVIGVLHPRFRSAFARMINSATARLTAARSGHMSLHSSIAGPITRNRGESLRARMSINPAFPICRPSTRVWCYCLFRSLPNPPAT